MNVWAISDLHLSFAHPERRERYAARWRDHAARIEKGWREVVGQGELVLIPGDLSMARNHRDLQPDLAWLDHLPGLKVLAPGNHDSWWNRLEGILPLLRQSLRAVCGTAIELGNAVICGARSVPVPSDEQADHPAPNVAAALEELDQALDHAQRLRSGLHQPLFVLWHHPPFDRYGRPGPCVQRFERAQVTVCVYGHMHIEGQWSRAVQGVYGKVSYYCVAADAVGFRPLRVYSM
jgi:predicted phosphohydrolase